MAHLIVNNEGDMEYGLAYALKLAKTPSSCKKVSISFATHGMMNDFVRNHFEDFIENRIPSKNGLDLNMYIPNERDIDD